MTHTMIVIEEHTADGVVWGVSAHGANPTPEEFVRCNDSAHAHHVCRSFNAGILSPWLDAATANNRTEEDY